MSKYLIPGTEVVVQPHQPLIGLQLSRVEAAVINVSGRVGQRHVGLNDVPLYRVDPFGWNDIARKRVACERKSCRLAWLRTVLVPALSRFQRIASYPVMKNVRSLQIGPENHGSKLIALQHVLTQRACTEVTRATKAWLRGTQKRCREIGSCPSATANSHWRLACPPFRQSRRFAHETLMGVD
jgi:hypothetical protein